MASRNKAKDELRGRARLRAEIVEMTQALHKVGAVSDEELAIAATSEEPFVSLIIQTSERRPFRGWLPLSLKSERCVSLFLPRPC